MITYKEGIRDRILIGVLFFAVILSVVNLIFTNMFVHDLGKVAVDVGLSVVSFSGLVIIFFMGINLLARDLDRKTIYMVLSRPIARRQYILGKFSGLGFLVLTSVIILTLFSAASVKLAMLSAPDYIPPDFSWLTFLLAVIFILLSLMIIIALAIFFTAVTSNSFLAMTLTACGYFIGQNVEVVRKVYRRDGNETGNEMFRQLIEIISWIFPDLAAFDLKTTAAYGLPLQAYELCWTGLYGISYGGIILIITILIFQRRELA